MSDVSTYIEALDMNIEDLYEMTEQERENYYEELIANMSDEEIEELQSELKSAFDALEYHLIGQQADLEYIIDSDDSTAGEIAQAEYYVDMVDGMLEICDDFSSEFADAQDSLTAHNVELTSGTYTFDAGSDVQDGEEFVIDASGTGEKPETAGTDEYADDDSWVDTDGDGYKDTQADTDGDGRADVDTNGDGKITEADMLNAWETQSSATVVITLDENDTMTLSSYDSETGETKWAVTKEDGTTYYVTIKGTPDIRLSGGFGGLSPDAVADTWSPELLHRFYENTTTSKSFGDLAGVEKPESSGDYYTVYDMSDYDNEDSDNPANELNLTPSDEDFENGREYTITCQEDYADYINLNFDDDVELNFSEGSDGEIVITATNSNGETVTIKIYDWQSPGDLGFTSTDDASGFDIINIEGGNITQSDANAAYAISATTEDAAEDFYGIYTAAAIIYHNGEDESLYEKYKSSRGPNWDHDFKFAPSDFDIGLSLERSGS